MLNDVNAIQHSEFSNQHFQQFTLYSPTTYDFLTHCDSSCGTNGRGIAVDLSDCRHRAGAGAPACGAAGRTRRSGRRTREPTESGITEAAADGDGAGIRTGTRPTRTSGVCVDLRVLSRPRCDGWGDG